MAARLVRVRLVLDTSVIVAAVRSRTGASAKLLNLVLTKKLEIALHVPLLLEYEQVLKRTEHLRVANMGVDDVDLLLSDLARICIVYTDLGRPLQMAMADRNDEQVLRLAARSGSNALVTLNVRHFRAPARELGVSCLLPGQVLQLLEARQ